jgi:hypothetical protein
MTIHSIKNAGDAAALTTALATFVGWLPAIAAALSIVWTIMRIVSEWDGFSSKVKSWFGGQS